MLDLLILGTGISHVVIVSNGRSMIRNGNDPEFFFHFYYGKGSGISDQFRNDFLSVNRKFPEPCSIIPERSGKFWFTEKSFRNFPRKGSEKTLETS